jgi:excisionase family DNA binding protein
MNTIEISADSVQRLLDKIDHLHLKIDKIKNEIIPVRKTNYNSNEVCEILGINKITFYRWIEKSYINAEKKGSEWYLSHSELDRINKPEFIRSRNKNLFQ